MDTEDKEDTKKNSVLRWFLSFTSIGGLSQHHSSQWSASKQIWLLLFFLGVAGTIWNLNSVIKEFSQRPIISTVTKETRDFLNFPAVTFCNGNIVHCGNLYDRILSVNESSSNTERMKHLCELYNLGKCYNTLSIADAFTYGHLAHDRICQNHHQFDGIPSISEFTQHLLETQLHKLDDEDIFAIVHRPNQLFKSCQFRQFYDASCYELFVGTVKIRHPTKGVCYSYNFFPPANYTGSPMISLSHAPMKVSLSGELYGLDVEMDTGGAMGMMRGVNPVNGMRVVLHEHDMLPMVNTDGVFAMTNALTKITMETTKVERQPDPYPSDCISEWPSEVQVPSDNLFYQTSLCQSFCLDDFVIRMCNCSVLNILEIDRRLTEVCDFRKPAFNDCLTELDNNPTENFRLANQNCTYCKPQCLEERKTTTISQITWPSNLYWTVLAERENITYNNTVISEDELADWSNNLDTMTYEEATSRLFVLSEIEEHIRSSFLKIQIYFNSRTVTKISESPKYLWDTMLSSIGGSLSLFLGISLISCFEVVELIVRSFKERFT